MNRKDFLKSIGLVGAAVISMPYSPYEFDYKTAESAEPPFFVLAEKDGRKYLIFHNKERIFKETIISSDNDFEDLCNLQKSLCKNMMNYYGQI